MDLMQKLNNIQEYFNESVKRVKKSLELLLELQKNSNSYVFIGDENHLHYGELLKVRNCLSFAIERVAIPDEKSETKMKLKVSEKIIEEPYAQIEIAVPQPEVVLRNCIEWKREEGVFAGYDKKIVGIRFDDEILTLPSIAKEITSDREYIKKCEALQEYLEKTNLPELYEKFFGKSPW